jgi:hypothetical protein
METKNTYTVYRLANMIEANIEDIASDGGQWLERVARGWLDYERDEAIEYGTDLDEAIHQAADGAVPIYTGDRWRVFADLQGWQFSEEIAKELGPLPTDMTEAVGWILYTLAERLIYALEAERDEDEGDENDN